MSVVNLFKDEYHNSKFVEPQLPFIFLISFVHAEVIMPDEETGGQDETRVYVPSQGGNGNVEDQHER